MSLYKFLHDQKIVRASMLLLKHSDALTVKETELSAFKTAHLCDNCIAVRCWRRFADDGAWCENCKAVNKMARKMTQHRTPVVWATRQLLKLCRTRARNWTAK